MNTTYGLISVPPSTEPFLASVNLQAEHCGLMTHPDPGSRLCNQAALLQKAGFPPTACPSFLFNLPSLAWHSLLSSGLPQPLLTQDLKQCLTSYTRLILPPLIPVFLQLTDISVPQEFPLSGFCLFSFSMETGSCVAQASLKFTMQ